MVYESIAIVVVLLGCTAFLARLIGHLAAIVDVKVTELDQNIAAAIQNTVSQLPIGDFEPVNPIQAAIAQFLMNKVQSESIQIPERADNGQFAKVVQESTDL
tara:strand:- start:509 stop:814 length:306 start_codon:yes stop_codon:yes gene_type:complete